MITRKYIIARLVLAAIFIYLFGYAIHLTTTTYETLFSKYGNERFVANCSYQIIADNNFIIQNSSSSYEKDATKTTTKYENPTPKITSSTPVEISSADRLRNFLGCLDKPIESSIGQRGEFWVLYNYVKAQSQIRCHESITYTTQGDFTFMDNLVPVVELWNGPVSVAMYAPGDDFQSTVDTIKYLRECTSPMVKQYVTFHIFFNTNHMPPQKIPTSDSFFNATFNCSTPPPYSTIKLQDTYKTKHNLTYPINVGRNVARLTAQTHFVFPSDIELYPSPNIIPKFLDMILKNEDSALHRPNPRIFVIPVFEISANSTMPKDKASLVQMLKNGTAVWFHRYVCSSCHNLPNATQWQKNVTTTTSTDELHIFHVAKRLGNYRHWEAFYIGTNQEPLYDERLTWEGQKNKMTQGYALCALDYDYQILDNVFLCHRPGIKTFKKDAVRLLYNKETNKLISKQILPELKIVYGTRDGCTV